MRLLWVDAINIRVGGGVYKRVDEKKKIGLLARRVARSLGKDRANRPAPLVKAALVLVLGNPVS